MRRARAALAVALTFAAACALELSGTEVRPGLIEPIDDAAVSDRAPPPGDVYVLEDAEIGDARDGAADAGCDGGTTCFASCKALKDANPNATDGLYTLKGSRTYEAYCDMTTAGGGWTLVARSVIGSTETSFGWDKATGSAAVDTAPYSLRAPHVGLTFREILVGTYSLGKVFALSTYKIDVPANFPTYKNASVAVTVTALKTAAGCTGTPTMLSNWGFFDRPDHYFMCDATQSGDFGLLAGGFGLLEDTCATSGLMHGDQGMIFVR
jgi:hypothetical protein